MWERRLHPRRAPPLRLTPSETVRGRIERWQPLRRASYPPDAARCGATRRVAKVAESKPTTCYMFQPWNPYRLRPPLAPPPPPLTLTPFRALPYRPPPPLFSLPLPAAALHVPLSECCGSRRHLFFASLSINHLCGGAWKAHSCVSLSWPLTHCYCLHVCPKRLGPLQAEICRGIEMLGLCLH